MSAEFYEQMYRIWQARGLTPIPREENNFDPSKPKQNQQQFGKPKQTIDDDVLDQIFEFVPEELTEVTQETIEEIANSLSLNIKDVFHSLISLSDDGRIEVEKGSNGSIYFMKSL